jgi:hypothetical protein
MLTVMAWSNVKAIWTFDWPCVVRSLAMCHSIRIYSPGQRDCGDDARMDHGWGHEEPDSNIEGARRYQYSCFLEAIILCKKTSKHHFKGIREHSHQNLIFLKLKLACQTNRTINSVNSKAELLHGEVSEAELSFVKWSSPKRVLNNDFRSIHYPSSITKSCWIHRTGSTRFHQETTKILEPTQLFRSTDYN